MTQSRKKQTTTNTPPETTTTSTTKTKFFLVMTKTFRARGGFTLPEELSWEIDVREITKDHYLRKGTKIPPEYFKIKKETIKRTEERTEEELSWADEEAETAWAVVGKYIQDRR